MTPSPSIQHILSAPTAPPPHIHFPNLTVSTPGTQTTTTDTKPAPTFSVRASSTTPGQKYIIIALDLDAPYPSISGVLSPLLHGVFPDLVTANAGTASEWVPLKFASDPEAEPAATWLPPTPPPGSAPHRYVFAVWAQPEGLELKSVQEKLGLEGEVGAWRRIRWDEEGAEGKLGLGEVLGGSWFCV